MSDFGDIWRGRIVVEGPSPLNEPLFTLWLSPMEATAATSSPESA